MGQLPTHSYAKWDCLPLTERSTGVILGATSVIDDHGMATAKDTSLPWRNPWLQRLTVRRNNALSIDLICREKVSSKTYRCPGSLGFDQQ
jgi:hypothetical protein